MKTVEIAARADEAPPKPRAPARWRGLESPWVIAATAAAPWPIAVLAMRVGISGRPFHGPLMFAGLLAAMVAWTHRAAPPSFARFAAAVLGVGALGELLANGLTDFGDRAVLADLPSFARALIVWLVPVAMYELAPTIAASSRVLPHESRTWTFDLAVHGLCAALGVLAYVLPARSGLMAEHTMLATIGASEPPGLWRVSPWISAALVLPFAVARCGPSRAARLPSHGRVLPIGAIATSAWFAFALACALRADDLAQDVALDVRRGVSPSAGAIVASVASSVLLAFAAAGSLIARALTAASAPSGDVTEHGDHSITLDGTHEVRVVALAHGSLPPIGAHVTLIGARPKRSDGGPFRDGAAQWVAERAWIGSARELRTTLVHRALGWIAWAAVGAIGLVLVL